MSISRIFRDTDGTIREVSASAKDSAPRSAFTVDRYGPSAIWEPEAFARVKPSPALRAALPPVIQAAYADLENAVYSGASRDQQESSAHRFETLLEADMSRVAQRYLTAGPGRGVLSLPLADLAVYYLGSMYASLIQQYETMRVDPDGLLILPNTDYATPAQYYTDTLITSQTSQSDQGASSAPGHGTAQGFTSTQHVGPLRDRRRTWAIDAQDIARHDAARGRPGAPTFDLLSHQISTGLNALEVTLSKLVVFGERPDLGTSAGPSWLRGLLYMKTPVALDLSGDGQTCYDNCVAFFQAAYAASNFHGALRPDTFTIPPAVFYKLSHTFIQPAAGGTLKVLEALLKIDGLREIRSAREYSADSREFANLTQQGDTMAAYYQGGIRQGGTQKNAFTFHRHDPKIITRVTGQTPYISDNGSVNGTFGGEIRGSTGAVRLIEDDGLYIGYQP